MTRTTILIFLFLTISPTTDGQMVKEKVEKLYGSDRKLIEQTNDYYNEIGKQVKSVTIDYRTGESLIISEYFYNTDGLLIKEKLLGRHAYFDTENYKRWTDTSTIFIRYYEYDIENKMKLEKEYNFKCNKDTCDITEYFYEGGLLKRKFCWNECSFNTVKYNYPIYYKYDQNDSLTLEQAWGPSDTTKIWYAHSYDYSQFPDKLIYEKFYRKDDSLHLDDRIVTKTEYLTDGRKSRVIFLEKNLSYEEYDYYKNGQLKSEVSIRNGRPIRKCVYKYNKFNHIVRLETYRENKIKKNKLKLYYFKTYEYKYY